MRNILVPLIILALVAAFLAVNLAVMLSDTEKLGAELVAVREAAESGDFGTARDRLEVFDRDLRGFRKYMQVVISHAEIDNIILSAERLFPLCGEDTASHFLAELSVTEALIYHIRTAEIPYFENIV